MLTSYYSNLIKYLYLFLAIIYLIVAKNGLEFVLKSSYYVNIFFIIGPWRAGLCGNVGGGVCGCWHNGSSGAERHAHACGVKRL